MQSARDCSIYVLINGTNGTHQPESARQPLPFIEELQDRQRAIAMNGAEPWNAAVEDRRAARRRDMEILRLSAMEAAIHVNEYIAGRLPAWKREALDKVANPVTALANLNRSIVQICMAQDRFDESAQERAARIAAEAEARAKAERAAEAERSYTAGQIRRAENKRQVKQAVRAISLTSLRLPVREREKLLAGLFRELDTRDGDAGDAYDGDPADTVADLCIRLGVKFDDAATHAATHRERKARMIALARAHLAALEPDPDEPDDGDEPDPAITPTDISSKSQGPPHG